MSSIIVNLFGAPGAGKSTTRADLFRILKQHNVNCEEVYEFAKKLTWHDRHRELACQPYVFGKQLRDMHMLSDKVSVMITDSPILLCRYYGLKFHKDKYHPTFFDFVEQQFKQMGGMNFFINRVKPYNPSGRNQTAEESDAVRDDLKNMLDELSVAYTEIDGDPQAGPTIAKQVLAALGKNYIAA